MDEMDLVDTVHVVHFVHIVLLALLPPPGELRNSGTSELPLLYSFTGSRDSDVPSPKAVMLPGANDCRFPQSLLFIDRDN